MDSKFYVSLRAARLLKEKEFNKTVDKLIHLNQYNIPIIESPEKYYDDTEVYNDYIHLKQNHYACPTKSEVIDWLESKGIIIGIKPYTAISFSYFILIDRKSSYDVIETNECFSTRLAAEEAAIIKALELL